jgi:hypothetical protein
MEQYKGYIELQWGRHKRRLYFDDLKAVDTKAGLADPLTARGGAILCVRGLTDKNLDLLDTRWEKAIKRGSWFDRAEPYALGVMGFCVVMLCLLATAQFMMPR